MKKVICEENESQSASLVFSNIQRENRNWIILKMGSALFRVVLSEAT